GISQEHELADVAVCPLDPGCLIASCGAGSLNLQQSLKLPNSVVNMNNVVSDFEISEVRKKRGGRPLLASLLRNRSLRSRAFDLTEDICLGEQRQIRCWKREPVREFANGYGSAMTSLRNLTFSRAER